MSLSPIGGNVWCCVASHFLSVTNVSIAQVSRNLLSLMEEEALEAVRGGLGGAARARRPWDDDFVLKRQFSALIPAFDPRPGRTNLNQTVGKYTLRGASSGAAGGMVYPGCVK